MTKLREECGIFGVFGTEEASVHTALGLHSLVLVLQCDLGR